MLTVATAASAQLNSLLLPMVTHAIPIADGGGGGVADASESESLSVFASWSESWSAIDSKWNASESESLSVFASWSESVNDSNWNESANVNVPMGMVEVFAFVYSIPSRSLHLVSAADLSMLKASVLNASVLSSRLAFEIQFPCFCCTSFYSTNQI